MMQIRDVMWLLVHVYEDIDDIETEPKIRKRQDIAILSRENTSNNLHVDSVLLFPDSLKFV